MTNCSSTHQYSNIPWDNTDLSKYAPYADKLDLQASLIDPSICPHNDLVTVIQSVKDPLTFYQNLTAELKQEYVDAIEKLGASSCPRVLFEEVVKLVKNPVSLISNSLKEDEEAIFKLLSRENQLLVLNYVELKPKAVLLDSILPKSKHVARDNYALLKKHIHLFNLLPFTEKVALFPKVTRAIQCNIFNQLHSCQLAVHCDHKIILKDATLEAIDLFQSLDESQENSYLKYLHMRHRSALRSNLKFFQSLPSEYQIKVIVDLIQSDRAPINLLLFNWSYSGEISERTAHFFNNMNFADQLNAFKKIAEQQAQVDLIKKASSSFKNELFSLGDNSFLNPQERANFDKLSPAQRTALSHYTDTIFKSNSLIRGYILGNSPFSIEGANRFLNNVFASSTKKALEYVILLDTRSSQIQDYNQNNKCSLQDVANQVCSLTKLYQIQVSCEEKQNSGWIFNQNAPLSQFENDLPSRCKINLEGPEGSIIREFNFPGDEKRYELFRNNMPVLKELDASNSYSELSLSNLRNIANQPGASLSAQFNAETKITNRAFGLFDPEHLFEDYFANWAINRVASPELSVTGIENVNENGSERTIEYQVSQENSFFQKITFLARQTAQKSAVLLKASNPATITNWVNAFDKMGLPYVQADKTLLTIENSIIEAKETSYSWIPNLDSFRNSTHRASDLALYNILPTIASAVAVNECRKFIKNAINNPKKTNGQKAAATLLGTVGILASVALAVNRLKQINI